VEWAASGIRSSTFKTFKGGWSLMPDQPKLLVWNYTPEEKNELDALLKRIGAPGAVSIPEAHGYLTLKEIIAGNGEPGEVLESKEKVVLFHSIPQKGVFFLIDLFRQIDLPQPIYAVVTAHSIDWPFNELLGHLVQEREKMEKGAVDVEPA
jgi:hypothetical protein